MTSPIQRLYNRFVRPRTPRKIAVFNGIPVRSIRFFDFTDEFPEYEAPLIRMIRDRVDEGERVVIVGGGRGVSSVAAARRVQSAGSVRTYEGSEKHVALVRETLRLNKVEERVTVSHAVVGDAIELADDPSGAEQVPPTHLPECDVLVLDCEGAETGILRDLEVRPRLVIVETHDHLDAPERETREQLDRLGYEVVDRGIEDADLGVTVLASVTDAEPSV